MINSQPPTLGSVLVSSISKGMGDQFSASVADHVGC